MNAPESFLSVALAATLAGCVLPAEAPDGMIHLRAPVAVTFGYAYDGIGTQWFEAGDNGLLRSETHLRVSLDSRTDEGQIHIIVHGADSCDGILWEEFAGSEEFQEGGIADEVRIHGNTGRDLVDFPGVDAKVAAWGTAHVFANSVYWSGLPEPISQWDAHFMYLEHGIRNVDGVIYDVTGAHGYVYDPAHSGIAQTSAHDDPEVHLRLTSDGPNGEGFDFGNIQLHEIVNGVDYRTQQEFTTPNIGPGVLRLEFALVPSEYDPAASVHVVVRQASKEIASLDLTPSDPRELIQQNTSGNEHFTTEVTGRGMGGAYFMNGTTHVKRLAINMWGTPSVLNASEAADLGGYWIPSADTCGPGTFRELPK